MPSFICCMKYWSKYVICCPSFVCWSAFTMIVIFSSRMYRDIAIELYLIGMQFPSKCTQPWLAAASHLRTQFPSKCTQPWLVAASHLRTSRNNKIRLMVTIEKALTFSPFADINLSWLDLQTGKVLKRFDAFCCTYWHWTKCFIYRIFLKN
jgi:hypothetical protein